MPKRSTDHGPAGKAVTADGWPVLPAERDGDAAIVRVAEHPVRVSNLDKVYWPDEGRAKGDLLAYYLGVAPLLVPHLRDRPLTLHRMPGGIMDSGFYEKQVPDYAPAWLQTTPVATEQSGRFGGGGGRLIDFVMVQDTASLLWVANLGCITMHPLHARAGSLDRPDYAIFDLDPFEPYTYADVRTVAKLVKVVLDGLGLRSWARTSGATGMQVAVPLDGTATFADARAFVERVGQMVFRAWPEKVTMAWRLSDRTGKVFIDHNMNRVGANIASVYSVRPLPGAPVSTPLDWDELDQDLEPLDFRMGTVRERFAQGDRFAGVLTERQNIDAAMDALGIGDRQPVNPSGQPAVGREDRGEPPTRRGSGSARTATGTGPEPGVGPGPGTGNAGRLGAGGLDEYDRKRRFDVTPEPRGRPAAAGRDELGEEPAGGTDSPGAAEAAAGSAEPADSAEPEDAEALHGSGPAGDQAAAQLAPPPSASAARADGSARPAGTLTVAPLEPGRRFTIQQHHARRLHHDVRFEMDGVLRSFAVPKRLPEEPGVRHLAVNTEDHPMEYLTFSGEIPAGEYGGGSMRLFDLGSYDLLEDYEGKLRVRLHGSRYLGAEYHFVRTSGNNWICFLAGRRSLPQPAPPPLLEPMLAVGWAEPFDDPDWVFEVKWDGHRSLATLGNATRLTSRSGRDVTGQFPELATMHERLVARNALVDGEVAAIDPQGRPSFELMQGRFHRSPAELAREVRRLRPVHYFAFDLLWLDGESLLGQPLDERRRLLQEVMVPGGNLQVPQPITGDGTVFFEQARALGLEGLVAKRRRSIYQPGRRSADWRKVKAIRRQDCVIVGWTPGRGKREGTLGSLLLAVWATDVGGLTYAGNVGTGFTEPVLDNLLAELAERELPGPPIPDAPSERGTRWCRPELVCEVEHQGWTAAGRLRGPSFKGIRMDKVPEDAIRE
jgi:bifunctional non-homologous end joining protein LigD